MPRVALVALMVWGGIALGAEPGAVSSEDSAFFEKSVRPVLVQRCYKCHSKEGEKIKGHLLVDSREGLLKGGDSGPAVVPGDVGKSLLIKAVTYADAELEMPPKGKLPQNEIDALVAWVKRGAPDPRTGGTAAVATGKRVVDLEKERRHWCYQPIAKPVVPAVKNGGWARGDIDRFILAKLEGQNIGPVGDAAPAALVRRVYFDLIGLPPTPEQIDAFVSDRSANRYEKLVDELLASPRFGERWGRHWLDVARFAESLTLRGFVFKEAWRYRDYVIEAFNSDRPFDRFMQEQIAGDLLPAETIDERRRQIVATAFLAIGNTNLEEQDKKQLEMDVVDEQIETIGRAFLAQTIGCARCHDHKFDPIPTKDYYALAGILHSTTTLEHENVSKWLNVPLPAEAGREAVLAKHEAAVAALQARVKDAKAAATKIAGKSGLAKGPGTNIAVADLPGIIVDDSQAKRVGKWKESIYTRGYIGAGYLTDDNDRSEEKTLTYLFEVPAAGKYEVRFAYSSGTNRATNVPVTVFSADGEKTITVDETKGPPIDGRFISLGQFSFEKSGQSFVIVSNMGADRYVIADAVQVLPAEAAGTATADAKGAKGDGGAAGESVKALEAELKKLNDSGPKRETIVSVRESKEIGDTKVHLRGNVHTLGEVAPRGFLQVVSVQSPPAIPAKQSGRKELGEWLARGDNPLPARVMVNRVWHWLTGMGIVRTTDNFGTTGETPANAELLDYLAGQFVADGWSVKKLIRQIVLSHAYQLSTGSDAAATKVDPENRLMWRMNRRRLDAECIRDGMLMTSGQLSLEMGGPTFKGDLASDFNYKHTDVRRSVYSPVFRNVLPDLFEVFDFADPSVGTGRRNVSTVAPQALYMMNHPWVEAQAKLAAGRLLAEKGLADDAARLERAYRAVLGRRPSEREAAVAMKYLSGGGGGVEGWTEIFHALFGSMDFRYVE